MSNFNDFFGSLPVLSIGGMPETVDLVKGPMVPADTDLSTHLAHYHCTEQYHRFLTEADKLVNREYGLLLTDGAKAFFDATGLYQCLTVLRHAQELLDVKRHMNFLSWEIHISGGQVSQRISDGNDKTLFADSPKPLPEGCVPEYHAQFWVKKPTGSGSTYERGVVTLPSED